MLPLTLHLTQEGPTAIGDEGAIRTALEMAEALLYNVAQGPGHRRYRETPLD